ncbi:hypothetical protein NUW58_g8648 [Xylaria curta]|uniref:Uncharacterized protein n=1 Tax=Xylaria curta TaxID=42375 RepID=A0ACC1N654_9PEZI|nr:hypothetical protein NUW58_g8648 [Xylaria curta]
MEKRWKRQVKSAVAGLKNLSWRIQGLALFPDRVVELGLWRPVDILASCGLRNHRELGFVSLPSDYRESSFSTGTRPRRGRTTAARFNPGASPSAKKPAMSQAKSNPKGKTITGINTDDLRVFKTGDAAMEARLLEAQQGVLMSGMEPSERAMLTEQWLENLPQCDTGEVSGSMCSD